MTRKKFLKVPLDFDQAAGFQVTIKIIDPSRKFFLSSTFPSPRDPPMIPEIILLPLEFN